MLAGIPALTCTSFPSSLTFPCSGTPTPRLAFQGLLVSSVLHLGEEPLRVLRAAWAVLSDKTVHESRPENNVGTFVSNLIHKHKLLKLAEILIIDEFKSEIFKLLIQCEAA